MERDRNGEGTWVKGTWRKGSSVERGCCGQGGSDGEKVEKELDGEGVFMERGSWCRGPQRRGGRDHPHHEEDLDGVGEGAPERGLGTDWGDTPGGALG